MQNRGDCRGAGSDSILWKRTATSFNEISDLACWERSCLIYSTSSRLDHDEARHDRRHDYENGTRKERRYWNHSFL